MAISSIKLQSTADDIVGGISSWRIWLLLGWQDIKLRYRRSQLGPFWITINMAIWVYTMGFLYGHLFHSNLSTYYPYVASGILTWSLISTIILECNDAFVEAQAYITQRKMPYTIFILRILVRNLIIFFHNLVPVIPILIYFHVHFGFLNLLYIIYGLFIIQVCGLTYGMALAILGTRYRDIRQIVTSLIQVIFLLSPIMWQQELLPARYQFAAIYNPFNQIINLIRMPLTGHLPHLFTIYFTLAITGFGLILYWFLLFRARARISFWV